MAWNKKRINIQQAIITIAMATVALIGTSTLVHAQSDELESLPVSILTQKLRASKPDTNRVNLMLQLSRVILFRAPVGKGIVIDSSVLLMQQATRLSEKLNYSNGKGNAMLMAALIYNQKGDRDKGLATSNQALRFFQQANNIKGMAEAYIIIGQHYGVRDPKDLEVEIKYYKMAISLFDKINAKRREAVTLVDLGDIMQVAHKNEDAMPVLYQALAIYREIGYKKFETLYNMLGVCSAQNNDYVNGIKYEFLAIKAAEQDHDTTLTLCSVYCRTANIYYRLKNYTEASNFYNKSLLIAEKHKDSVYMATVYIAMSNNLIQLHQYKQLLNNTKVLMSMSVMKDSVDQAAIQENLIDAYLGLKQYENARQSLNVLIDLSNWIPQDNFFQIGIHTKIIFYYITTHQYAASVPHLKLVESLSNNNNVKPALALNYYNWFRVDSALGKYNQAIKHLQLSRAIDDSLFNEIKGRQIAAIQIENETLKKDQDIRVQAQSILLLNKQAQLADSRLLHTRTIQNVSICGSVLLIIIIGLGYNRYRLKQQSNLQLQTKQNEINQQKVALEYLLADKEILMKEIHHRVKNNLHMISSLLESQSAYLENEALQAVQKSQHRVQAISLIHQKLYVNDKVTDVLMSVYLREIISYLNDSFVTDDHIVFDIDLDPIELDVTQAVPVGLIVNEVITNSIKYAFPKGKQGSIGVSMKKKFINQIVLTISDNGVGIPKNRNMGEDNSKHSLGMSLIKGLSESLHGTVIINSDNGTKIELTFFNEHETEEITTIT